MACDIPPHNRCSRRRSCRIWRSATPTGCSWCILPALAASWTRCGWVACENLHSLASISGCCASPVRLPCCSCCTGGTSSVSRTRERTPLPEQAASQSTFPHHAGLPTVVPFAGIAASPAGCLQPAPRRALPSCCGAARRGGSSCVPSLSGSRSHRAGALAWQHRRASGATAEPVHCGPALHAADARRAAAGPARDGQQRRLQRRRQHSSGGSGSSSGSS